MRHVVKISDAEVVLTSEQMGKLTAVLAGAEIVDSFHVGDGKGTIGYKKAYLPDIIPKAMHEWLKVSAMDDEFYESSKLIVKLQREQNF